MAFWVRNSREREVFTSQGRDVVYSSDCLAQAAVFTTNLHLILQAYVKRDTDDMHVTGVC